VVTSALTGGDPSKRDSSSSSLSLMIKYSSLCSGLFLPIKFIWRNI
jgi:hypothetical protein